MPDVESTSAGQQPRSTAWQSAVTVVQEAQPPFIPAGPHAMTIVVEFPPGDPGTPPHRQPRTGLRLCARRRDGVRARG
jgi:hypothetical protein